MTMKRIVAALMVAPFIALAAGPALAKEKVRVGIAVSWPGYAFWKLIEKHNLAPDYELEITIFEDPIQGHNLLAAGQLDIYGSTLDYIPVAIEQGFTSAWSTSPTPTRPTASTRWFWPPVSRPPS
jgi:NitT/TauT family transport system substrate-binding protein